MAGGVLLVVAGSQIPSFIGGSRAVAADEQAGQKPPEAPAPADVEMIQGRVVDLQRFLTKADQAPEGDAGQSGAEARRTDKKQKIDKRAPVGIVASDESLIDKITGGETAYLVIFTSGDKEQEKAYDSLRSMAGQKVKLTGKLHDRGGLKAICVHAVQAEEVARAPGAPVDQKGG
jgi:hypothetical protein